MENGEKGGYGGQHIIQWGALEIAERLSAKRKSRCGEENWGMKDLSGGGKKRESSSENGLL